MCITHSEMYFSNILCTITEHDRSHHLVYSLYKYNKSVVSLGLLLNTDKTEPEFDFCLHKLGLSSLFYFI